MTTPLRIQSRVCPQCKGNGQILVDVVEERLRTQLRLWGMTAITAGMAIYFSSFRKHTDWQDWIIVLICGIFTIGVYGEARSGDTNKRLPFPRWVKIYWIAFAIYMAIAFYGIARRHMT